MPIIESDYKPVFLFKNGHIATIYSGVIRKVNGFQQNRETLTLSDGDFLDLDWSYTKIPTEKVVILLHGLEGNAQRPYVTGSAKIFNENGFDACAVNFRGCSGRPNNLYKSYHSGASEDLASVIDSITSTKKYEEIYIKGFSLGGNLTLKYLGENRDIPKKIKAAIAVSVPCHLESSQKQLQKFSNILYNKRFGKNLKKKLLIKQKMFPNIISLADINNIDTLKDFDDTYTSKAHGFKDALDYYEKCSCLQFLPSIDIPVLLINAQNDSFLGKPCYPVKEAKVNPNLYLEMPKHGGHVGFLDRYNTTYTEKRAIKFVTGLV